MHFIECGYLVVPFEQGGDTADSLNGTITNVAFFDGATQIGSDARAPFEVNPTFGLGQHILTAIATDNTGAQATSAPVSLTIMSPRLINPIPTSIAKGDISIELQTFAEGLQSPLGFAVPDE